MVSFATTAFAAALTAAGPSEWTAASRTRLPVTRTTHELLTAPDRHVRATTRAVQDLLEEGFRRSKTFHSLMSALETTDLIVHIEITNKLPASVAGRLLFATAVPGGPRFVRIQIAPCGTRTQQIAAIAHELQHALEVAGAAEVRDRESFALLYARIGLPSLGHVYDTLAAQAAGQRVLLEIGS